MFDFYSLSLAVTFHITPGGFANGDLPYSSWTTQLVSRRGFGDPDGVLLATMNGATSEQKVMIKRRGRHYIRYFLVFGQPSSTHDLQTDNHEPLRSRTLNRK